MPNYQLGKIYQIVNDVNNIVYIGSTCQPLCGRMTCHRSRGKTLNVSTPLYLAMHEIGVEHFRILLVQNAPCNSKEELHAIEYSVMRKFQQRGVFLYNATIDGRCSEETRVKLRDRVISEVTRAKISCTSKGRIVSEATRAKISKGIMRRGSVCKIKSGMNNYWRFYWRDNGKKKFQTFSEKKYGYNAAHGLALFCQEEMYPIEREDDSEYIQEIKNRLNK